MTTFVDRKRELQELNYLLDAHRAQFAIIYGRRRIGKTTLLAHWAKQADCPYIYWVARNQPAESVRQSLANVLWAYTHPDKEDVTAPVFESWDRIFEYLEEAIGDTQTIVIFDEFPFAVNADPALPSHLQVAWDHWLKETPITLILAGSHISMMEDLRQYDAPLYGRFSAELNIGPMPFSAIEEFFPKYPAAERVAVYATIGSVPAYLEQFNPEWSLSQNIRHHLFRRAGFFRNEPENIITELIREPAYYEEILRVIAHGAHTFSDIADQANITKTNLTSYLQTLQELYLIERRIPATVPKKKRETSRRSRYYIRDPFLRFHFKFVDKYSEEIELEMDDLLWDRIKEQFRSFVGATAFEELSREWVRVQARAGNLSFVPEIIGEHWRTNIEQIDVCAVNWRDRAILLGECKWGKGNVGRSVIRELIQKSSRVIPDSDWDVYYAFFAREGFTDAARSEAAKTDAMLIDLERLDTDLS